MTLDPQLFLAHRLRLENPSAAELREAFTGLPKRGFIEILCAWERRLELQQTLERCGAFALSLEPQPGFRTVLISAYKGKAGPCYETGRSTIYEGLAAAALDDDNHLIAGTMRVCEKTGSLHTLPPYRGLLTVSAADPALLQRLETDPIPFDCNTFEADAQRLAAAAQSGGSGSVCSPEQDRSDYLPVMNPGPLRFLLLHDGAMLRRGVCYGLPEATAKALAARDRLVLLPAAMLATAQTPERFPAAFAARGPRCLLEDGTSPDGTGNVEQASSLFTRRQDACATVPQVAELSSATLLALQTCSDALKSRLLHLLERAEPYFILTGSDPGEPLGCCPNDLVGEANRLVAAGVLDRNQVPAAPDTCTNTIYAFAGEISGAPERPVFQANAVLRRQVSDFLREPPAKGGRRRRVLGQILVALLLLASLGLALRRAMPLTEAGGNLPLNQALNYVLRVAPQKPRVVVCIFGPEHKCPPTCPPLPQYCRDTVNQCFAPELAAGTVVLREVAGATPERRIIGPYLNGAMVSIGLVSYSTGEPQGWRLLGTEQIFRYQGNPAGFSAMLQDEIRKMLNEEK